MEPQNKCNCKNFIITHDIVLYTNIIVGLKSNKFIRVNSSWIYLMPKLLGNSMNSFLDPSNLWFGSYFVFLCHLEAEIWAKIENYVIVLIELINLINMQIHDWKHTWQNQVGPKLKEKPCFQLLTKNILGHVKEVNFPILPPDYMHISICTHILVYETE